MLAGAAARVDAASEPVAAAAAASVGRGGASGPGCCSVAPRALGLLASCLNRSPVICNAPAENERIPASLQL